jgi:MYXO-CTERM domain-containing protein
MAAVRWPASCISLVVHVQDPPAPWTSQTFGATVRAAAATWSRSSVSCTALDLRPVESYVVEARAAYDNQLNVMFRKQTWDYEPSALAITTVFATQAEGRILDADMELNAVTHHWGDLVAGAPGPGVVDLQNTLTHELGHLIGLDHNCYLAGSFRRPVDHLGMPIPDCAAAPPAVQESTMFPGAALGDVERRTLAPDDVAAVCAIHPASLFPDCPAAIDAGTPEGDPTDAAPSEATEAGVVQPGDAAGEQRDARAPAADAFSYGNDIIEKAGCTCTTGGRARPAGGWALVLLGLARLLRRRRPISRRAPRYAAPPPPASPGG